jgi:hypothetical protein
VRVTTALFVSLDCPFIADPAFDRDRGTVSILDLRVHLELWEAP